MKKGIDRLVDIIEDYVSMEMAIRIIIEAAETKVLPNEGSLPCFNDSIVEENFTTILEKVTGKEY